LLGLAQINVGARDKVEYRQMQMGGFLRPLVMILNAVKTVGEEGRGSTYAGHRQHSSNMRWLLRDAALQVDALATLFAVTMSLQPMAANAMLRSVEERENVAGLDRDIKNV